MDSKIPEGYLYSKQHEWVKEEGGLLVLGISDYAQHALGDIVYVDLKAVGTKVSAGSSIGTIESVKAAEDVYTPVDGTVESVNPDIAKSPESVNRDSHAAWLLKLKDYNASALSGLMKPADYKAYLSTLDH